MQSLSLRLGAAYRGTLVAALAIIVAAYASVHFGATVGAGALIVLAIYLGTVLKDGAFAVGRGSLSEVLPGSLRTLFVRAALGQYEGGIRLLASCHAMLDSAGKKVALLTGTTEEGEPESSPIDASATFDEAIRPARATKRAEDGLPY